MRLLTATLFFFFMAFFAACTSSTSTHDPASSTTNSSVHAPTAASQQVPPIQNKPDPDNWQAPSLSKEQQEQLRQKAQLSQPAELNLNDQGIEKLANRYADYYCNCQKETDANHKKSCLDRANNMLTRTTSSLKEEKQKQLLINTYGARIKGCA